LGGKKSIKIDKKSFFDHFLIKIDKIEKLNKGDFVGFCQKSIIYAFFTKKSIKIAQKLTKKRLSRDLLGILGIKIDKN
jgi:secreted Zn-dependent insulinase-like peptidase